MSNPNFGNPTRNEIMIQAVARAFDPPPPGPFFGRAGQPYAPRKLNPLLLSVDAPKFTHPGRDPVYMAIIRAWDPPPPSAFLGGRQPLEAGKNPPSLLSVDSPPAYLPELLVLPPEDTTAYFRAQRWQKIAATAPVVTSTTADWLSQGSGTATFAGFTQTGDQPPGFTWKLFAYDDDTIYYQTQRKKIAAISVQAATSTADWFSQGAATAAFVGAATDAAAWNSSGTGIAQFVGTAAFASDWTVTSVGTASFVGAASDAAAWAALGAATVAWNEASVSSGDWAATGVGTAAFASNAAIVVTADWAVAGSSTVKFASPAPQVANRDGWRVRSRLERRRRKDEQELMAIAKAVLPFLQRNMKQPTRISL